MSSEDYIKEQKYKAYGYARIYYVRITDNTGHSPKLLYATLKSICRKLKARYLGVKSDGHGKYNRPHIHALLLAENKADLEELKKLIPKGFSFKIWRIKSHSDLASSKKYIKEHIGKKKRGFLLNHVILALKILIRLLVNITLRRLKLNPSLAVLTILHAHQRALAIRRKEGILWKE